MGSWAGRHSPSRFLNGPDKVLRCTVGFLALSVGSVFLGLSLFVVPAPTAEMAVEVSGTLLSVSPPHPEYGDMGIVLDGGRSYYVNRADEVEYFAWEQMLSDLHPGDTVYLTVVTPLIWRWMGTGDSQHLPVAGVRTANTMYMDPSISADTWTAQSRFKAVAGLSLLLLGICLLPELVRRFKHRPPAETVGV